MKEKKEKKKPTRKDVWEKTVKVLTIIGAVIVVIFTGNNVSGNNG